MEIRFELVSPKPESPVIWTVEILDCSTSTMIQVDHAFNDGLRPKLPGSGIVSFAINGEPRYYYSWSTSRRILPPNVNVLGHLRYEL